MNFQINYKKKKQKQSEWVETDAICAVIPEKVPRPFSVYTHTRARIIVDQSDQPRAKEAKTSVERSTSLQKQIGLMMMLCKTCV